MNAYADEKLVAEFTKKFELIGHKLFQVFWLAKNAEEHIKKLLEFFNPNLGSRIIDLGCGVGETARLMKLQRPDLDFILVNQSQAQLFNCPDEFMKIECDFHEIPYSGEAKAIMITYALGHADLPKVLTEAARLLKNGGHLYLYDISSMNDIYISDLYYHAYSVNRVIREAKKAGFDGYHSIYENPKSYHSHMFDIIDEKTFDYLFLDIYPYIAKFTIHAH